MSACWPRPLLAVYAGGYGASRLIKGDRVSEPKGRQVSVERDVFTAALNGGIGRREIEGKAASDRRLTENGIKDNFIGGTKLANDSLRVSQERGEDGRSLEVDN